MNDPSPATGLPVGLAGLHYGVTQVSLAVRHLDDTMDRYHRLFGWAPWQVFDHIPPVHHATELRGAPVHYTMRGAEVYVGSLNFELLEPLEGPNLWTEFIDRRGEGIASIATMFLEREDGDAVKAAFRDRFGIPVTMRAEIGDHIEYYYLDTETRFGCLIESGSGHAIDFVKPARVHPHPGAQPGPAPLTGLVSPISQVSLVVSDLDARIAAYRDAFGWGPWRVYSSQGPGGLRGVTVRGSAAQFEVRWAQALVGEINVELIEPAGGDSPWQEFLATKGEGIASITVTLRTPDDVERVRRACAELGIGVLARGSVGDGAEWVLFDSEEQLKALIQVGTGLAWDAATPDMVEG
jgi:catechol 2,3-dioxygenase-like lactoylglutathione lyase family enzyme